MGNTCEVTDTAPEVRYAGLWIRASASFLDGMWMMPLVVGLGLMLHGQNYLVSGQGPSSVTDVLIRYVLPLVITVGFWVLKSATPGKALVKIKIVDAKTHTKACGRQLLIRHLAYYVSMLFCFVGYLWVAVDARKQAWHDKIAGTLVVYNEG